MGLRGPGARPFRPLPNPRPPPTTVPEPPRSLGEHGLSLWHRVLTDFNISDAAELEILAGACSATERAEALREQIDRDGTMIEGPHGPREHPGLKHELACRAFVARSLQRLGLLQPKDS